MPRINLLPAKTVRENGRAWLEIDDFRLPSQHPPQENVIVAVRPEDVAIFLESQTDALEFKVYSVLPSGPELFVQVKRRDRTLMIRETQQLDLQMDQPVWVKIDPLAINLYDQTSGNLLISE
jgi:ABC-type sugar transport system ATPase subunit